MLTAYVVRSPSLGRLAVMTVYGARGPQGSTQCDRRPVTHHDVQLDHHPAATGQSVPWGWAHRPQPGSELPWAARRHRRPLVPWRLERDWVLQAHQGRGIRGHPARAGRRRQQPPVRGAGLCCRLLAHDCPAVNDGRSAQHTRASKGGPRCTEKRSCGPWHFFATQTSSTSTVALSINGTYGGPSTDVNWALRIL
jgi:hypothetical protein